MNNGTTETILSDSSQQVYKVTAEELRSFVERVETLDAEKAGIADSTKEVLQEAKSRGYEAKIIRKIVAIRKRNRDDVDNENAVTEMYMSALGM
jgi:uncharacterized protein (UPF0335 family)